MEMHEPPLHWITRTEDPFEGHAERKQRFIDQVKQGADESDTPQSTISYVDIKAIIADTKAPAADTDREESHYVLEYSLDGGSTWHHSRTIPPWAYRDKRALASQRAVVHTFARRDHGDVETIITRVLSEDDPRAEVNQIRTDNPAQGPTHTVFTVAVAEHEADDPWWRLQHAADTIALTCAYFTPGPDGRPLRAEDGTFEVHAPSTSTLVTLRVMLTDHEGMSIVTEAEVPGDGLRPEDIIRLTARGGR